MQSHPELNSLLANQRAADLHDLAGRLHRHETAVGTPLWRRLAGSALIRLGEALTGDRHARTRSPLMSLGAAR